MENQLSGITIRAIQAKSLIRGKGKADSFFQTNYGLNPYQGCQHDCLYCDGKANYYRMHQSFGTLIKYKKNAPQLLERFFQKKGFNSSKRTKLTDFLSRRRWATHPAQ